VRRPTIPSVCLSGRRGYDERVSPEESAAIAARPMRADGRRNRELVLAAAREAFAEGGRDVGVAEIARRAGVGPATLFRHFASKDDLLAAIIDEMLEQIEITMKTALAMEDPWESVVYMMTAVAEHQARDQLFLNSAGPDLFGEERLQASTARTFAQLTEVLERAQAAGVVRADLMPTDLPFVLAAVGGATNKCGGALAVDAEPDLWRRYLGLALDGLRPEGAHPLAPAAPSMEQLTESKKRGG
jgi:AcrR family transcriptional regulator